MVRGFTALLSIMVLTAAPVAVAQEATLPDVSMAPSEGPVVTGPPPLPEPKNSSSIGAVESRLKAGAQAALDVIGISAPPPSDVNEPYSYGTINYSVMFTPMQVENMKKSLSTYEYRRRTQGDVQIVIEEEFEPKAGDVKPAIVEPASYPVFTLSSIAYHHANDWTVWISGMRITPKTNDQALKVVAVGPGSAQFQWQPEYMEALLERRQSQLFASTDPVKHKLSKPNTATFDTKSRSIAFTLRPNQTFSAGYMATFEGSIAAPELESLIAEEKTDAVAADAQMDADMVPAEDTPAAAAADAAKVELGDDAISRLYRKAGGASSAGTNTQATIDTMLENQQKIKSMVPKRAAPAAEQPATN